MNKNLAQSLEEQRKELLEKEIKILRDFLLDYYVENYEQSDDAIEYIKGFSNFVNSKESLKLKSIGSHIKVYKEKLELLYNPKYSLI